MVKHKAKMCKKMCLKHHISPPWRLETLISGYKNPKLPPRPEAPELPYGPSYIKLTIYIKSFFAPYELLSS